MPPWAYMKEIKTRSGLFLSSTAYRRNLIVNRILGKMGDSSGNYWHKRGKPRLSQ
jgi:hypothetical protein